MCRPASLDCRRVSAAHPLPDVRSLPPRDQLLYGGAVATDYAIRTALASVAAAVTIPYSVLGGGRREREALEFYADLAARNDAHAVFEAPQQATVEATPGRAPDGVENAHTEILRFTSGYEARNPKIRKRYAQHANNATARAQHWRHESGPRPTLLVIHGFGASPAWLNVTFFALRDVFASGWDVILHTLPFHGSRRSRTMPLNGLELFSRGMAHMCEAIIQGVHDARVLIDHLQARGVDRIGATGLSLGGYTTGALATVDDRLDFAIPNVPVTWLPDLFDTWFPANVLAEANKRIFSVDDELLTNALAVHSPLSYPTVLPRDRLMIVAGLGDRLAPPRQAELLWEHWGRPAIHWFAGSHLLHFGRGSYLAAMRRLMAV